MSNGLLPYEVIARATAGDTKAIYAVLKHFDSYTSRLSMSPVMAPNGTLHLQKDEDIKRELEIELITKLSRFDPVNG